MRPVGSSHARTWPGVLAVWVAAATGLAHATETDQYFAIGQRPRDSLGVLNEKVNRELLGAVDLVNRRASWERYSCEDVAHRVFQRFRISGLHKIELWAEHSPRLERVPAEEAYEPFLEQESLYRNERLWDWGLFFGVKKTFNVAGVHMGADKLSHFFKTGWKYYQRYREHVEAGVPEREVFERLVRYGVSTEAGTLGLATTEVFSFGDLEANYQGFLFYRSLCRDENPRLVKTSEGWRLNRPFDWREYVSPRFDESFNNSAFTAKRWREVQAILRKDYCPRLDSDAFVEHYGRYARFEQQPDDFSARYVQELSASGQAPRQEEYSLWAACGRRRPDFVTERGAIQEGDASGGGGTPRYEAPRFDDAIFRVRGEVGGGGRSGAGSEWSAVLRTRLVLHETVVPEDTWDAVRTPEYLLWGALDGLLLAARRSERVELTHADLRFTPMERRFELNDATTGHSLAISVAMGTTRLTRFVELDRRVGVEASVIGVRGRLGNRLGERQRVGVFASLAVDGVGYRGALHLSELGAFHGVHIATVTPEAGVDLLLGQQLRVGLVLGGSAGFGLGWTRGVRGLSTQSDLKSYAEGQVDVTRSFRLFVRAQRDGIQEPGRDRLLSTPSFLGGAAFLF
jgi:hypothetical protein